MSVEGFMAPVVGVPLTRSLGGPHYLEPLHLLTLLGRIPSLATVQVCSYRELTGRSVFPSLRGHHCFLSIFLFTYFRQLWVFITGCSLSLVEVLRLLAEASLAVEPRP